MSKIAHDHPHLHSGSPSLKYLRFVLLWSYIITKSWILKVCSAFFSIILTEQYSLLCTWHIGLSPSGSPGRCWCRVQATIFPYCWNQLSEIINCHGCWMDVGLCSSRQFGTPGNLAYAETLQTIQGHSGSFGICRNIRTSDWPTWWMQSWMHYSFHWIDHQRFVILFRVSACSSCQRATCTYVAEIFKSNGLIFILFLFINNWGWKS